MYRSGAHLANLNWRFTVVYHNWHYHCFRVNSALWLLNCSRYSDGSVVILFVDDRGAAKELVDGAKPPDLRQLVGCSFQGLSPHQRAGVRALLASGLYRCTCPVCRKRGQPANRAALCAVEKDIQP